MLTPAEEEESVSDETLLDVPSEQDEILVDAQLPSNVRAEDDISTTTTLKPALAVGVLVTALCVRVAPPVVVVVVVFVVPVAVAFVVVPVVFARTCRG